MLALLKSPSFDLRTYSPRRYIVAATDAMSGQKAFTFELAQAQAHFPTPNPPPSITSIPRSREVGQSFITSIWTTLYAALHAVRAVVVFQPDLILTNGPGTALPVVVAGIIICRWILGVSTSKVVFVESIARVRKLSLTGKFLYHLRLTDEFLVQWDDLLASYPRVTYAGRVM